MKYLPGDRNFLAIDDKFSNFEDSKVAILSVPYEHTVSYGKGAAEGPAGIIEASAFVEFYDDEFDNELCFDIGITTLEPLDLESHYDKEALDIISNQVSALIQKGKFVVTLGGEHTISTAPIEAHYKHYPDMCILHFDAHADLRESYEDTKYSHACFMKRVCEFFPPEKVTQVGIRALSIEESQFIREKKINTFYASAIRRGKYGTNWQDEVVKTLGENIYITFDIDFFDPSIMPATGTPEPDGFLYSETLDLLRMIRLEGKNIIGFDVVELAPMPEMHHPNLMAARLVYKLLNYAFHRRII
jgi:agmatinase